MSQIHSCGKEKKEVPVDSTILADWGRALSFPSRSLRKGSYKIITILLPLTFSQSGIHCAQPSRTEQPWTRTKSLFLRCASHFYPQNLKEGFIFSFISRHQEQRDDGQRKEKMNGNFADSQRIYLTLGSNVRNIQRAKFVTASDPME